jgi:hypothetical protein
MKKHLFGLGAMLVGAGLMFVLMHGEVRADSKPEPFVCSYDPYMPSALGMRTGTEGLRITHCKTKNLDCGYDYETGNMSCVKTGIF